MKKNQARHLILMIGIVCGMPCTATLMAQPQQGINYQAVARSNDGAILPDQNVSIRFSITDSNGGSVLYQETHNTMTNQFGLITVHVGNGTTVSGDFSTIPWSTINAWLQVEMDTEGGTAYIHMGSSPLLSVPYALYAASGNPGPPGPMGLPGLLPDGSATGNTPFWNGNAWEVNNNNLFNNGGNVGIHYPMPASKLHIQTSFDGDGIYMQPELEGQGIGMILFNTTENIGTLGIAGIEGNWLPTSDADDLILKNAKVRSLLLGTSDTERMRINAHGDIGINNMIPESKLHITGDTDKTQLIVDAGMIQNNGNPLIRLRNHSGNDLLWIHSDEPSNTFIGLNAGRNNDVGAGGIGNAFIGVNTGSSNLSGYLNTALGAYALSSNTSGFHNTAIGYNSLSANTTGFFNTAIGSNAMFGSISGFHNTAIGWDALYSNTTGSDNTAIGLNALGNNRAGIRNTGTGSGALQNNTGGEDNTAYGYQALHFNISGSSNVADGIRAMYNNIDGVGNTAVGLLALFSNTSGWVNTAVGANAMYFNLDGYSNTGIGTDALYKNQNGIYNTAIGERALYDNTTGHNNTAIGQAAYFTSPDLSNTSCLGYFSGGIVNASNRIEIGNSSVSVIAGQVGFSIYSDKRIKTNIREDVPGLAFITMLKPVTYHLNIHQQNAMQSKNAQREETEWDGKYDIEQIQMTGFIAQDVEAAAQATGYNFSGVQKPENPDELYSLRYSDFVVPLTKAVQELNDQNNSQQQIIAEQQETILALKEEIQDMQNQLIEIKLKLGMD